MPAAIGSAVLPSASLDTTPQLIKARFDVRQLHTAAGATHKAAFLTKRSRIYKRPTPALRVRVPQKKRNRGGASAVSIMGRRFDHWRTCYCFIAASLCPAFLYASFCRRSVSISPCILAFDIFLPDFLPWLFGAVSACIFRFPKFYSIPNRTAVS